MKAAIAAATLAAAFGIAMSVGGVWAAEATTDTTTTGAVTGTADVPTTTMAVNATKTEMDELKKLSTIKSVKVMKLNAASASDAQLKAAMDTNKADTTSLRTAIQANADLQAKLKAQNVMVENIVAIDVDPDGNVIVYTQG